MRLYTRHDHDTRRERDAPEIARADLAETALELHAQGEADLAAFPWFEPPPAAALAAADELLVPLGRRMLRFPAHPRQARLLCEAEDQGVAREGALVAALLSARELRVERRGPGAAARIAADSDLIEDLDAMLTSLASTATSSSASITTLDGARVPLPPPANTISALRARRRPTRSG